MDGRLRLDRIRMRAGQWVYGQTHQAISYSTGYALQNVFLRIVVQQQPVAEMPGYDSMLCPLMS